MEPKSPADAQLELARLLESLFVEVFSTDQNADGSALTPEQRTADEEYAVALSTEVLDTLGLEVVSVDADGSMLVRLDPDVDD